LDALEARLIKVTEAIVLGEPLQSWGDDPVSCQSRWMRQDVGYRLLTVAHQCEEAVAKELHALTETFADTEVELGVALQIAEARYRALSGEVVLPDWTQISAVGYALPDGKGAAVEPLKRGVLSAFPVLATAYGESFEAVVTEFAAADPSVRKPLAARFESWLGERVTSPVSDLLHYEAMCCLTGPVDAQAAILGDAEEASQLRVAEGVVLRVFTVQPADLAEDVEFGDRSWGDGALTDVDGQPVPSYPCGLIGYRDPLGSLETAEVDVEVMAILLNNGPFAALEAELRRALVSRGILVSTQWDLD